MRRLVTHSVVLVVLALTLPIATAHARGGPASGAGSSSPVTGVEKEATGADIAKAKSADPIQLTKEIEEDPKVILQNLDKEIRRTDGDADQMQMNWQAIGNAALDLWIGKTGILREALTGAKRALSAILLRAGQREVPFPEWVKSHSTFMNEVVSRTGLQMAWLKGALNHDIEALEKMAETAPPIMKELHKRMSELDKNMDRYIETIYGADTLVELDDTEPRVKRAKTGILALKVVIKARQLYVGAALDAWEKSIDEKVAMVQGFETTFLNPEITKGVSASWKKYVEDWILHLQQTIDFCAERLTDAHEAWAPFLENEFYRDIPCLAGLEPGEFHEVVDNVLDDIPKRRKTLEESTELSREISKYKMLSERENMEGKREFINKTKDMANEVRELINAIEEDPAPDRQLSRELTDMWEAMNEIYAQEIVDKIEAARPGVGGDTFDAIYQDLQDALGKKEEQAALKRRFEKLKNATEKEIDRLYREWDAFENLRDVYHEKAHLMFEKRGGRKQ